MTQSNPIKPEQIEFLSLAFPKDRRVLHVQEIATVLDCTAQHVYDLVEEGELRGIDISGRNNLSDRRTLRIPVEAWAEFIKARTTAPTPSAVQKKLFRL